MVWSSCISDDRCLSLNNSPFQVLPQHLNDIKMTRLKNDHFWILTQSLVDKAMFWSSCRVQFYPLNQTSIHSIAMSTWTQVIELKGRSELNASCKQAIWNTLTWSPTFNSDWDGWVIPIVTPITVHVNTYSECRSLLSKSVTPCVDVQYVVIKQ